MEQRDLDLIEKHRKDNYDLNRLATEHGELGAQIEKLESAKGLADNEQIDLHKLKKKKLDGKDKIEKILATLR